MAAPFNKEDLIQKVENAEQLTVEEEAWYLEHVLKFTNSQYSAENIIAIGENNDPTIIID